MKKERVMNELLPRAREIVTLAMKAGITVSIDAEESHRLDIELELYSALLRDPALAGYEGIGFVLQAYQKRAVHIVDYLVKLCHQTGRRIPIRLVKGAYWDTEIKAAQVMGLPSYPVFTRKEHTDVSYLACAQKILQQAECFYPQFATHNALTAAAIIELAGTQEYEFQRLHGMGEVLHEHLMEHAPCRIYAPVGRHEDLLAYLIRRLLENGANTSFVHLMMDKNTPPEALLKDPVAEAEASGGLQNRLFRHPLHLYSDRLNSHGYDLGNASMLDHLMQKLLPLRARLWQAGPRTHTATAHSSRALHEPAHRDAIVGYVEEAGLPEAETALAGACAAAANWQARGVEYRASLLETVADELEAHTPEIISLLMREAGKTLADTIAELRESVDFCRYYAAQARALMGKAETLEGPTGEHNYLHLAARGVFACISPWNFPLSIFTGQIVAALVTGNCVIAKPAQQTPLIADFAVRLMYKAGIPKEVMHLLPGDGKTLGAALMRDERINGVVFTGSMETARTINRALAERNGPIVPFIAETGGQNCMVVDSSALPEQVVDDVILSAFGSAGQRCSALRVLYIQEEIADRLITLLAGAMQELQVGEPSDPATDIGPVIDLQAQTALLAHIAHMKTSARLLAVTPHTADAGSYVAPHLFEIHSIHELTKEVFGPVLHVIRYKSADWEHIRNEIHSTGYGLTFGVQSRIEKNIAVFTDHIHAGNIYVNRGMTGATVGVQPFGGEGLSGTGPKAGGPHYLQRFVTERTVCINSAAIGGNVELLAK